MGPILCQKANQPCLCGWTQLLGRKLSEYYYVTKYYSEDVTNIEEQLSRVAPLILGNVDARQLLSKDFSPENLKSKYMAAIFRTTDNIFESWIRKTAFGFWIETKPYSYTRGELADKKL